MSRPLASLRRSSASGTGPIVNVIQKYAHTGNTGDRKIFMSTVDDIVKIRKMKEKKMPSSYESSDSFTP
jgi:hypothetical protein